MHGLFCVTCAWSTHSLAFPVCRKHAAQVAFAAIMSGQVMVVGPYKDIRFNVTSVFMYKAIVMQGVAANETFQQPVAGPSNCPVGVCYQPATNSKVRSSRAPQLPHALVVTC